MYEDVARAAPKELLCDRFPVAISEKLLFVFLMSRHSFGKNETSCTLFGSRWEGNAEVEHNIKSF